MDSVSFIFALVNIVEVIPEKSNIEYIGWSYHLIGRVSTTAS